MQNTLVYYQAELAYRREQARTQQRVARVRRLGRLSRAQREDSGPQAGTDSAA